MRKIRFSLALLLCCALLLSMGSAALAAELVNPITVNVDTGDGSRTEVRACYASYPGNVYLSLTDLAAALSGTGKQFCFSYNYNETDGEFFTITTGTAADKPAGGESIGENWLSASRNRLFMDGVERKYYTFRNGRDLYMATADVMLLLDVEAEWLEDGSLRFATGADTGFVPDLLGLKNSGYFDYFTGIMVGDADTGRLLYSQNRFNTTSIASTTKLMTTLLILEAIDAGRIGAEDAVYISENAERVAKSGDGMIKDLKAGSYIPLQELLKAMLLASSNEAAIALAEHLCGTEAAFTEQMNLRAQELGLKTASFRNCNGLPSYTDLAVTSKQQNRMSAADMFTLSAYLLQHFPEITEITDMTYCRLPSLDTTVANSNPLVFNMEEVNGLKTGSTNRAGYCEVASMPVTVNGETHTILLVLFGAESAAERGQASELLMRAAMAYFGAGSK